VVLGTADVRYWCVDPEKKSETMRRLADGTVAVRSADPADYVLGGLYRLRIVTVAKGDGRVEPGGRMDLFLPGLSGSAALVANERYLVFALAPVGGPPGPSSLAGTLLTRPEAPQEAPIAFDPRTSYTPVAGRSAAVRIAPENEQELQAILGVIRATAVPTVALTDPAAGSTVKDVTALTASASDDVAVTGVQFKVDDLELGTEVTSPPYTVSWDTRSGRDGTHTLTAVARDAVGNATVSAPVAVTVDNTPPTLALVAAPGLLWPPDRRLVTVTVTATVSDGVDPHPSIRLVSITASEPIEPGIDVSGAEYGTDDRQFQLRATRAGRGVARAYLVTYSATDAAGNTSTATATVIVPHDQRR
jgi:hypothetical protein